MRGRKRDREEIDRDRNLMNICIEVRFAATASRPCHRTLRKVRILEKIHGSEVSQSDRDEQRELEGESGKHSI